MIFADWEFQVFIIYVSCISYTLILDCRVWDDKTIDTYILSIFKGSYRISVLFFCLCYFVIVLFWSRGVINLYQLLKFLLDFFSLQKHIQKFNFSNISVLLLCFQIVHNYYFTEIQVRIKIFLKYFFSLFHYSVTNTFAWVHIILC